MPLWSSLSFQDSTSPLMEQLVFFHDHSMVILILITILTFYLLVSSTLMKVFNKFLLEGQEIETIWTVLPSFLLIFIAFPSLKALYLMEESRSPLLTVKGVGHQWYWSYEYSDFSGVDLDSFMEMDSNFRLLEVSDTLVLPFKIPSRVLLTSNDVIHSWTLPSLGVKVDALPGRLNQLYLLSKRGGLLSGQCSEICGANHSFMPILLESVTTPYFFSYLKSF